MTPEQHIRARVAARLRAAIQQAAHEFADGEMVELGPGLPVVSFGPPLDVYDVPLFGVRAAVVAHGVAFAQMREWAEAARGAGRTWDEIADALDLPARDDEPRAPGEVAFEWLIEGRDPDAGSDRAVSLLLSSPAAHWTCRTCGARVRDHGPYESHPDNNETGHDPGCARRAAEIAAHHDRWRDF